ncbi:5,10-methylenetetrahydrofolate reductase [Alkalispirochaeta sphaeroplastigenens]|uniref:Methylenetetrahydrofolate reductase n=1 Tax=Alkalispirochaeta sphaeroplastigenens TaxID=1187066 RepID=A0A2S4K0S2_9SPIO|nr:methylenetetrahydrofolate reductase [NAD(P)H] [Alkalispirochaeta sphaeroplastigenens]POR05358.1 5,10-methylenetetrahydrofolate reductase [Alkalispirochaeta sphaeroplastigenens]
MAIERVSDLLGRGKTLFSFEFFPPRTEQGWNRLFHSIGTDLLPLEPAYVSVTYGAGGSTREYTHRLVTRIQSEFNLTVVAHLTCVGSSRAEIAGILDQYRAAGVCNILALRGDLPRQGGEESRRSDFSCAAELVSFVRNYMPEASIGVAGFPEGHPDTPNRLLEIEYLRQKVDAGADYIVTQLFFDNRDYFDYVERLALAGITLPVVPGIMPVTTRKGMQRMAELAAGARFPAALLRAVERTHDDQGVNRVGTHWATAQVADLLNRDVPGVHLYTLNNSWSTIHICRNLGLESYRL